MHNWQSLQVADFPRVAEQIHLEEIESINRLEQLKSCKVSIEIQLAALKTELALLWAELAPTIAAGVATTAFDGVGADIIECKMEQIQQIETAITQCTANLYAVNAEILSEKNRLHKIRVDKRHGRHEVEFRTKKLSSIEDMGGIIGHYRPYAETLIHEYELMGDQLQMAGRFLGRSPDTRIQLASPETEDTKHYSKKSSVSSTTTQKNCCISNEKNKLPASQNKNKVFAKTPSKEYNDFVDGKEQSSFQTFQVNIIKGSSALENYTKFSHELRSPVATEKAIFKFVRNPINGNKRVYIIRPRIELHAFSRPVIVHGLDTLSETKLCINKRKKDMSLLRLTLSLLQFCYHKLEKTWCQVIQKNWEVKNRMYFL